jgi:hypothetical protein
MTTNTDKYIPLQLLWTDLYGGLMINRIRARSIRLPRWGSEQKSNNKPKLVQIGF